MVIYAPLSLVFVYFTQEITRTQTKSRLSAGSLGTRLRGHKLAGICCHRLPRWWIDRFPMSPIVLCYLSLLRVRYTTLTVSGQIKFKLFLGRRPRHKVPKVLFLQLS